MQHCHSRRVYSSTISSCALVFRRPGYRALGLMFSCPRLHSSERVGHSAGT